MFHQQIPGGPSARAVNTRTHFDHSHPDTTSCRRFRDSINFAMVDSSKFAKDVRPDLFLRVLHFFFFSSLVSPSVRKSYHTDTTHTRFPAHPLHELIFSSLLMQELSARYPGSRFKGILPAMLYFSRGSQPEDTPQWFNGGKLEKPQMNKFFSQLYHGMTPQLTPVAFDRHCAREGYGSLDPSRSSRRACVVMLQCQTFSQQEIDESFAKLTLIRSKAFASPTIADEDFEGSTSKLERITWGFIDATKHTEFKPLCETKTPFPSPLRLLGTVHLICGSDFSMTIFLAHIH